MHGPGNEANVYHKDTYSLASFLGHFYNFAKYEQELDYEKDQGISACVLKPHTYTIQ